jgi:phage N-6-adenine-methyltransferase
MGAQAARAVDSGNEWATPRWVVEQAAEAVGRPFDLDAAASAANAQAPRFFTRQENALEQEWAGVVWLNPPFSRSEKACGHGCQKKRCGKRGFHLAEPIHGAVDFARKVVVECRAGRIEALAWHGPCATDTSWYRVLWPFVHLRIDYSGRIRYNGGKGGGTFPSQTLIIRPERRTSPAVPTILIEGGSLHAGLDLLAGGRS